MYYVGLSLYLLFPISYFVINQFKSIYFNFVNVFVYVGIFQSGYLIVFYTFHRVFVVYFNWIIGHRYGE